MGKLLKVTLRRSAIGRQQVQKDTLRGLGLTKREKTVYLENTSANRGMVWAVRHLVAVEPATEEQRDAALTKKKRPTFRVVQ